MHICLEYIHGIVIILANYQLSYLIFNIFLIIFFSNVVNYELK